MPKLSLREADDLLAEDREEEPENPYPVESDWDYYFDWDREEEERLRMLEEEEEYQRRMDEELGSCYDMYDDRMYELPWEWD